MLKKIKSCPVCNSKNFKILKKNKFNQKIEKNFYVQAILENLNITYKFLEKKINKHLCQKCYSIYHSPWFNDETARKIFSNIYGQHNYGWQNLNNFITKKKTVNHGNLFEDMKKITNFKSYGEYNCPFSGLYFDILLDEIKNKESLEIRLKNSKALLHKTQDAFISNNKISMNGQFIYKGIKQKYQKLFIIGDDAICWGRNCISQNCNCAALGENFFGYKTQGFADRDMKKNLDLFGFFMTIDHSYKPLELIKSSLQFSKVVLIHAHINPLITKQHLFTLSKDFSIFLKKNKVFCYDLTKFIEKDPSGNKGKKYLKQEMYLACSLNKSQINLFCKYYENRK